MSKKHGVNYGVLRGKVINSIPYKSGGDHFQIEIQADTIYRIAVDVFSVTAGTVRKFAPQGEDARLDTDRFVMYYKDEDFKNDALTAKILDVSTGFTLKKDLDPILCLDYLRAPLFPVDQMKVVEPTTDDGNGEDLSDDIGPWVTKATNNPNAEVFAFGSGWDDNAPGGHPDTQPYFKPNPSVGIHDIHMNQGDSGSQAHANGIHQDGALFFYFKDTSLWVAMFFKFQNQVTGTDDNGNPKN